MREVEHDRSDDLLRRVAGATPEAVPELDAEAAGLLIESARVGGDSAPVTRALEVLARLAREIGGTPS